MRPQLASRSYGLVTGDLGAGGFRRLAGM